MNSRITYIVLWAIFLTWNLYLWRKNKDQDILWLLGVGTIGFVGELIYQCLILFHASANSLSMASNFFYVFDPIGAVIFVGILLKSFIKGGGKSGRDPSGQ
jgi:hypothetical protein